MTGLSPEMFREREAPDPYLWRRQQPGPSRLTSCSHLPLVPFSVSWKAPSLPWAPPPAPTQDLGTRGARHLEPCPRLADKKCPLYLPGLKSHTPRFGRFRLWVASYRNAHRHLKEVQAALAQPCCGHKRLEATKCPAVWRWRSGLPHSHTITRVLCADRETKCRAIKVRGRSGYIRRSVLSNSATPWTAAWQAPLSSTISWSLLKLTSIESVMPSNRLIFCHPFSCLQSFPASGSFPINRLFASGGQNIGGSASASVLPMNIRIDFL